MEYSFANRFRTKKIKYTVEDIGVSKKTDFRTTQAENFIPFERITVNKVHHLEHTGFLLALAGVFLFATIVSFADNSKNVDTSVYFIWPTLCLLSLVSYFFSRQRKLFLQTAEAPTIEFFYDRGKKLEVESFVQQIITERNKYLVSKYGVPNRMLEYSPQLENFNWLLNTRAISKTEYDRLLQELNGLFNHSPNSSQIGFSKQ